MQSTHWNVSLEQRWCFILNVVCACVDSEWSRSHTANFVHPSPFQNRWPEMLLRYFFHTHTYETQIRMFSSHFHVLFFSLFLVLLFDNVHVVQHTHDIQNYLRMFSFSLYWLWFSLSLVLFFYVLYVVTHLFKDVFFPFVLIVILPLLGSVLLHSLFCNTHTHTHTHHIKLVPTSEII